MLQRTREIVNQENSSLAFVHCATDNGHGRTITNTGLGILGTGSLNDDGYCFNTVRVLEGIGRQKKGRDIATSTFSLCQLM
jgi:hypothetical protein